MSWNENQSRCFKQIRESGGALRIKALNGFRKRLLSLLENHSGRPAVVHVDEAIFT